MLNKNTFKKYIFITMLITLFMLINSVSYAYMIGYIENSDVGEISFDDNDYYTVDLENSFSNDMNDVYEKLIIYSECESGSYDFVVHACVSPEYLINAPVVYYKEGALIRISGGPLAGLIDCEDSSSEKMTAYADYVVAQISGKAMNTMYHLGINNEVTIYDGSLCLTNGLGAGNYNVGDRIYVDDNLKIVYVFSIEGLNLLDSVALCESNHNYAVYERYVPYSFMLPDDYESTSVIVANGVSYDINENFIQDGSLSVSTSQLKNRIIAYITRKDGEIDVYSWLIPKMLYYSSNVKSINGNTITFEGGFLDGEHIINSPFDETVNKYWDYTVYHSNGTVVAGSYNSNIITLDEDEVFGRGLTSATFSSGDRICVDNNSKVIYVCTIENLGIKDSIDNQGEVVRYVPPVYYDISYDKNGGSGDMSGDTVLENTVYTILENGFEAPEDKQFKCWEVGSSEKQPGDEITISGDTIIKAIWEEIPDVDPSEGNEPGDNGSGDNGSGDNGSGDVNPGNSGSQNNSSSKKSSGTVVTKKKKEEIKDAWSNADDWAVEELKRAQQKGLIPAVLNGKDFSNAITREEFAAVSLKLYETISNKKAKLPKENPFIDTQNEEVLKAYSVGITVGISDNEFGNGTITREQMATMLTRALKAAGINVKENLNSIPKFADDSLLQDWSRDSVYFMASKQIILGTGNNEFSPLGTAKIEEALLIVLRCVESFK